MIILATHFGTSSLPDPFVEVRRQDCEFIQGLRTSTFFWSEYPALLSRPAKGWLHYRCVLDPTGCIMSPFPWESRSGVLSLLGRMYDPGVTYVGEDTCHDRTMWDHFVGHHPEAESFFTSGCEIYRSLTGDNAIRYMRKKKGFAGRNMIVGPLVEEWSVLAKKIIIELDKFAEFSKEDRYGGYVLERLFSFFVSERDVRRVRYLYFNHPSRY